MLVSSKLPDAGFHVKRCLNGWPVVHVQGGVLHCEERWAEQRLQYTCCTDLLPRCLQDSTYKYYEIIMVDIAHKVIRQVCLPVHLWLQRPISWSTLGDVPHSKASWCLHSDAETQWRSYPQREMFARWSLAIGGCNALHWCGWPAWGHKHEHWT